MTLLWIWTTDGTEFTDKGSQPDCPWRPFASHSISRLTFHHKSDITRVRKKRKTYRRFSGAIFLEAFDQRLFLNDNGLRRKKSQKQKKREKKCEICS